MRLVPKNWGELQHYKDRCPPWIKLHRNILNDRHYMCLPLASKALAPLLWLLACESKDGSFDASMEELTFRLRFTERELRDGLKGLIDGGFLLDASTKLAPCLQVAPKSLSETERETEGEGETKERARPTRKCPSGFSVTTEMLAWAKANTPLVNIESSTAAFVDHTFKTAITDWAGAWRNWMRRDQQFAEKQRPAARRMPAPENFDNVNYGELRDL